MVSYIDNDDILEKLSNDFRFAESGFSEKIRPVILLRDNYKCVICGKPSKIVHHINGNRLNYKFLNLVVVCKHRHSRKEGIKGIFSKIAEDRQKEIKKLLQQFRFR